MTGTVAAAEVCKECGREVRIHARGMCGNCYRVWQRDNFPPNATCAVCGRRYYRRPCRRRGGETCCRACFKVWKRGRDQHNRPTDGAQLITRRCEWCDRPFEVEKRQVDKGLGRFCSIQCSATRQTVGRLRCVCQWCGETFDLRQDRVFYNSGRFCSRSCLLEAKRDAKLPREPPRGSAYKRFRGEWVSRVGHCEICGVTDDLCLHHRIRTRERPDLLYDAENLQVLCNACHTRVHAEAGHMTVPEDTP